MRRPILLLTTLLSLITWSSATAADTARVARVTGIDSFVLEDGTTIGLLGITKPSGTAVSLEDCVEHLRSLIEGKEVIIVADTTITDTPGKTPQRLVYVGDRLINRAMIADGYAAPSRTRHQLSDDFTAAERSARSSGNGAHATERSTAVQCSGTTQRGTRCKRMTTNLSGRCWQH